MERRTKRAWLALVAAALAASAAGVKAAPMKTAPLSVVEIFTSQGCSSCPPADANVRALADRPDMLALTFGVTYWDQLGWKDTFAQPAFTARQYAYAKTLATAPSRRRWWWTGGRTRWAPSRARSWSWRAARISSAGRASALTGGW